MANPNRSTIGFQHDRYIEPLGPADLFLCPFPYGNRNSVAIRFSSACRGVCPDSEEAHVHADTVLFAGIGLPGEFSAKSVVEYAPGAIAIRLIDDAAWCRRCTEIVRTADLNAAFFSGDPHSVPSGD